MLFGLLAPALNASNSESSGSWEESSVSDLGIRHEGRRLLGRSVGHQSGRATGEGAGRRQPRRSAGRQRCRAVQEADAGSRGHRWRGGAVVWTSLGPLPQWVPRPTTRWAPGVVWTSLGPLPRWVRGPTTRWAPGTTRLALHGT
jgi:hypothetical protein